MEPSKYYFGNYLTDYQTTYMDSYTNPYASSFYLCLTQIRPAGLPSTEINRPHHIRSREQINQIIAKENKTTPCAGLESDHIRVISKRHYKLLVK
jgi:hypothetical protein